MADGAGRLVRTPSLGQRAGLWVSFGGGGPIVLTPPSAGAPVARSLWARLATARHAAAGSRLAVCASRGRCRLLCEEAAGRWARSWSGRFWRGGPFCADATVGGVRPAAAVSLRAVVSGGGWRRRVRPHGGAGWARRLQGHSGRCMLVEGGTGWFAWTPPVPL